MWRHNSCTNVYHNDWVEVFFYQLWWSVLSCQSASYIYILIGDSTCMQLPKFRPTSMYMYMYALKCIYLFLYMNQFHIKASALRECIDHIQSKREVRLYTLQQLNTSNPVQGRRNLQDLWKVVSSFLYGCAKPTSKFPLCRRTYSELTTVIQKTIVLIVSSVHELRYNSMWVDQPVGTCLLKLAIWMDYI